MRRETFSLWEFTNEEFPFNIKEYSLFKHGSKRVAKEYGRELAMAYMKQFLGTEKEILVFASPYHFIPSASSYIKDEFLTVLNRELVSVGHLPAGEARIHRRLTYHTDYGKMSVEERARLIHGDKFYVDGEYIKDKFSIFLDDVRITGSHEGVVTKLLPKEAEFQVVYQAKYKGENPLIENYLNTNFIKSLGGMEFLIDQNDFFFNVRNIRMILSDENYISFLGRRTPAFLQELYDLCIGNHYHLVPAYQTQLQTIKNKLNEHTNFAVKYGEAEPA